MRLSEDLENLLEEARSAVEEKIRRAGGFALFAVALKEDGDTVVLDTGAAVMSGPAVAPLLVQLMALVESRGIIASAICAPMPETLLEDGWRPLMIDLEHRDGTRVYVILSFRKHDYLGWQYGTAEYSRGRCQLFARSAQAGGAAP